MKRIVLLFFFVICVSCNEIEKADIISAEPEVSYVSPLAACARLPAVAETNNVNNLRPGNIKLVMAMGDSITAGSSAKDSSVISTKEYRGLSYSIGFDAGITTFPNLLQETTTLSIYGGSTGTGTNREATTNGYNAAVSGGRNKDMPAQAEWLVKKINADPKINKASDWKVVTIWIGSNNLCDVCSDPANNNGADFEKHMTTALNYLYNNVQRLLVNIVSPLDVSALYEINGGACSLLHSIACKCVGTSDTSKRNAVSAAAKDYGLRAFNISKNFNGKRNDFAVVVQPFLSQSKITERNLLSQADCFHPSALCHQYLSIGLWNNLLSPSSQKKTSWSATDKAICPTASTLLYTN